jgi:hypothetical protein
MPASPPAPAGGQYPAAAFGGVGLSARAAGRDAIAFGLCRGDQRHRIDMRSNGPGQFHPFLLRSAAAGGHIPVAANSLTGRRETPQCFPGKQGVSGCLSGHWCSHYFPFKLTPKAPRLANSSVRDSTATSETVLTAEAFVQILRPSVWARPDLRDREGHRLAARRASGEDLMVRVDQLNQHLVLAGR